VLKEDGWEPVLFFSNFNISPHREYLRRRKAAVALARSEGIAFEEDLPNHTAWQVAVAEGYESCPEGGARCARCFRFSLQRAFEALARLNCVAFTTSLTISPPKRSALLHAIGHEIGGERFIPYDFKKQNGFQKANVRAAELGLYRQIYCGCEYSIRHKEPYKIAILGMGYRGRVYAQWALEHPEDLTVIAIAEPDEAVRRV
jgi:predicted adenine nucleotide alpha hydrolase (AANH) superfamily ATPase